MFYGSVIGKRLLVTNTVTIANSKVPPSFNGYKIIQLSDIHLGSFNHSKKLLVKTQQMILEEKPDLILFTGDLVNNFSNETKGWEPYFRSITRLAPCYSILGNHDYGDYTNWNDENEKRINFQKIIKAHSDFGFTILNNRNEKVRKGIDSIYVAGVENWGLPPFPQYANLDSAIQNIPENVFVILLSHDPAHWEKVVKHKKEIDLTLSGHTHGFQWGITKAGIKFSLAWLARKNWGGLYEYEDSKLYVNTGLGAVAIPWRINMPPEITVFTLKRVEVDR
jgi:predicted MPP superfamily phosphohydrolase